MKSSHSIFSLALLAFLSASLAGCKEDSPPPPAAEPMAIEQFTVRPPSGPVNFQRPEPVKHLYVYAKDSGQILGYSMVYGKVTIAGKSASPKTAVEIIYSGTESKINSQGKQPIRRSSVMMRSCGEDCNLYKGLRTFSGSVEKLPNDVMQEAVSFGNSELYFYWFDTSGQYHRHFFADGQVIVIVDQPLVGKRVFIEASIAVRK